MAVVSDDDHAKDSHQGESAYSLLVKQRDKPVQSLDLGFGTVIAMEDGSKFGSSRGRQENVSEARSRREAC